MKRGVAFKALPEKEKTTMRRENEKVELSPDNDTSFEIDDPEDEEIIEQLQVKVKPSTDDDISSAVSSRDATIQDLDGLRTPTNDIMETISITGSSVRKKTDSDSTFATIRSTEETDAEVASSTTPHIIANTLTAKKALSHSPAMSFNSEFDTDSDVSSGSYSFSSTPTTADVADVSSSNKLNRQSNGSGSSGISRNKQPDSNLNPSSHQQTTESSFPYLPDDLYSDSLPSTATELDETHHHPIQQQQQQQPPPPPRQPPSSATSSVSHQRGSSMMVMNSTMINIPTMILTHPSASLQEANTNLRISSSLELPTFSSTHRHIKQHQRSMSATSHRSVTSQHSSHTAQTSLSIVEPKSRIWSALTWLSLTFQTSGIGAPSVYHAMVVIFLEFFAWGLLTMPVISVLNQTFPEHTFLMNGLVMGIKGILSFLSAPLIGALSDIWGRKFFLLITVFFTCVPIPLMTINTWWFFAMISISGMFAVTFSVVFAYVADVTTLEERSRAYGLVSATFAASLVISPALGAVLMERYGDTLVVALATAIAVLDVFFILVAVPESLPEKIRPSSWGAPINWEQADPFSALRKVGTDSKIVMQCVTVLLSYLPEAGQYSCIFVYLKFKMGFNTMEVAIFIAVVGILAIISQVTLGCLMRKIGGKNTIILGLILETTQLFWYGFGSTKWMMWSAGVLAALGSITYPAISAFVSIHSTADSQGAVQGMVTGMRGLCNGLGPAMFGIVFYLCNVDLNNEQSVAASAESGAWYQVPGPPFAFGALMVILAILVALFIPEGRGDMNSNQTTREKKRASVDVQYEVEAGHKPTSPLMRSDSLAQL